MTPFPNKKYEIIYADPPWSYSAGGKKRNAKRHYPTMKPEEIYSLPVSQIAAENCSLFLWATFPNISLALKTIERWGFTYKTIAFNWVKTYKKSGKLFMGCGNYTRSNSEICLLATKGKPQRINASIRSVIISPIEKHSKKPDEVRARRVDLMGDLPRIELFARERSPGWDAWGNEI